MSTRRLLLLAVAVASVLPNIVRAECSVWFDQGDGTSWAECVDDQGNRSCWRINNTSGSTAYQVSCSS